MCMLLDKDLMSMQEVRDLVDRAYKAQHALTGKTQAEIDAIVESVAKAGVRNAKRLAKMANEETGFGKYEDKIVKNYFGSMGVWNDIKDMKTIGFLGRDEEKKLLKFAVPVGVVAGLIPSTNPTSTAFYKAEIAIKAGNAIVFSPHPNALNCITEAVKVIRQAVVEAGGPEDLVSVISVPTIQATDTLLKHPQTALILATGGSAMVRAAYSSGTPAIGVGPGNGPAYIERTADIPDAVRKIVMSKTFDNGTICASEQSVVCDTDMEPQVRAEMERQGCYFLDGDQIQKLSKFILRANGTMNPMIVGKSAQVIADLAQITIPAGTKILVAKDDGIGKGHPYSNEKLCPILGFYTAENYVEICKLVTRILSYEGAGHTFSMHTKDPKMLEYFGARVPASRIIVNTPSTFGGIGATTGLIPALTLGCGAVGGSATSENVGPQHLMNIRYVAEGILDADSMLANVHREVDGAGASGFGAGASAPANVDIDALVEEIMKRLHNI